MSSSEQPLAPHGRLIIVADDEHHIRAVVASKLRSQGYAVREAAHGEEAFELARSETPALIVSDLQMPVMSGLQLCQSLHRDERTAGVPVLLVTARGHLLSENDLANTNVARVMSKPFSARELVNVVQEILSAANGARHAA